jgi:hypothetical protein
VFQREQRVVAQHQVAAVLEDVQLHGVEVLRSAAEILPSAAGPCGGI